MRLTSVLICSLGICACTQLHAQTPTEATGAGTAGDNLSATTAVGEGILTGTVVDATTGRPLTAVTVSVTGPNLFTTTGVNGEYRIPGVPAGTQNVTFYKGGYQYYSIPDATVREGQVTRLDFGLTPSEAGTAIDDIVLLDAISVSADVVEGSEIGLIGERQMAPSISDAIGSEAFSRLSLGDAAAAMTKVTGVSVVDGKYVFIRGLGDRYSNTLLDNVAVPSADPDRRSVQMDQFPTAVLENIVTKKSFTPDQPGAFAGGSVNIRTKSFPDIFVASIGASIEYNSNTTGKDILTVPGGGRDWLAMDDGTRGFGDIPDPVPSSLNVNSRFLTNYTPTYDGRTPAEELDRISNEFHNETFFPSESAAGPNFGFDATLADLLVFSKSQELGYIFSFTYDSSSSHYGNGVDGSYQIEATDPSSPDFIVPRHLYTPATEGYKFADYLDDPGNNPPGRPAPAFGVTSSTQSVDWGAFGQVAYRFSPSHEIGLRVFHNQSAEDRVRRGVGEALRSDSDGRLRENYDLLYTERGITSANLSGTSVFEGLGDLRVEWRAAHSASTQDQPDYRSMVFVWNYIGLNYETPSGAPKKRYFRELEDTSDEAAVDLTLPFEVRRRPWLVKFGAMGSDSERTNREREFEIRGQGGSSTNAIVNFPNVPGIGILSGGVGAGPGGTNQPYVMGVYMYENPSLTNYDGEQFIRASYLMLDAEIIDNWRVIAGARIEATKISTTPLEYIGGRLTPSTNARPSEIDQTDILPGFHIVYNPVENMNIRAAYGRTIARPTYWELADVKTYDGFRDEERRGDPDLEMTTIDNFDLRWEWFVTPREVTALSLFYKKLDKPIEVLYLDGAITPQNVDEATVYGIEFETRRYLGFLHESLENTSAGMNLAFISSEAAIPDKDLEEIRKVFPDAEDTRELFGQSPYTFNLDITQEIPGWGSSLTLVFNVVGERLDTVVYGAIPDVYEQPAPQLDFIYSQRLGAGFKMKLTAKNILNPDKEKIISHNGRDYTWQSYTSGVSYSLGVTYDF